MARFADKLPLPSLQTPSRPAIISTQRPRVAIGLPSGDLIYKSTALSIAMLTFEHGWEVVLQDSRSSIVTNARNEVVKQSQRDKCEWIFWIDSDMVLPPQTLLRLLSHKKEIVGATYHRRVAPYDVLGRTASEKKEDIRGGLVEMHGMPTGCLLTHMSVFQKMKRPYFRIIYKDECPEFPEGQTLGEDFYFCNVARELGYKIWCDVDLSYHIGHIGEWVFRPGLTTARLPTGDAPKPDELYNPAIQGEKDKPVSSSVGSPVPFELKPKEAA